MRSTRTSLLLTVIAGALLGRSLAAQTPDGQGMTTIGPNGTFDLVPGDPALDSWPEVFQAAVDSLPGGVGGEFLVLAGDYAFGSEGGVLVSNPGVAFRGSPGATLVVTPSNADPVALFEATEDDFTLEGLRFLVQGPAVNPAMSAAIRVVGDDFTLKGCKVEILGDAPGDVRFLATDRPGGGTGPFRIGTLITGNSFVFAQTTRTVSGWTGIYLEDGTAARIYANVFRSTAAGTKGDLLRAVHLHNDLSASIYGNKFRDLGDPADAIILVTRDTGEGHHVTVSNNGFESCDANYAIEFNLVAFVVVSGNVFGGLPGGGVIAAGGSTASISGNQFHDVGNVKPDRYATHFTGSFRSASVVGNQYSDCGRKQVVAGVGAYAIHVVGNQFVADPLYSNPMPIETAIEIDDSGGSGGHFLHDNNAIQSAGVLAPNAYWCDVYRVLVGAGVRDCSSGTFCNAADNFNNSPSCP